MYLHIIYNSSERSSGCVEAKKVASKCKVIYSNHMNHSVL